MKTTLLKHAPRLKTSILTSGGKHTAFIASTKIGQSGHVLGAIAMCRVHRRTIARFSVLEEVERRVRAIRADFDHIDERGEDLDTLKRYLFRLRAQIMSCGIDVKNLLSTIRRDKTRF